MLFSVLTLPAIDVFPPWLIAIQLFPDMVIFGLDGMHNSPGKPSRVIQRWFYSGRRLDTRAAQPSLNGEPKHPAE